MKLTVDQVLRKAAALAGNGRAAEARCLYDEILRRYPANHRAAAGLKAVSTITTDAMPPREGAALIALYNQGKCQEVIARAAALRRRYAPTPLLHTVEGAAHAKMGQFDRALSCHDRALSLEPAFA